jgi:histone deacetylase 1/2
MSGQNYFKMKKTLADTLAAIGHPLHADEVITYIVSGLGAEYESLVSALNVKSDLTLNDVYSYLLGYEHRQAIYNADPQIGSNSSSNFTGSGRQQGRGHGGGYQGGQGGGGQGRNGGGYQNRGGNSGNQGGSQGRNGGGGGGGRRGGGGNGGGNRPICQLCGKIGHVALKCYKRFDSSFHGGEPEQQPSANVAGTSSSYQVDPNWYSDTGATDHVTSDLNRLSFRERYNGNDTVQIGNGAGLHIAHIGQSSINTSADNSLALRNVLHVPHISKNLVSIHRLTKDNDVSVEFFPSSFLVKDLATRRRLLRGICRGGLYPFPPPTTLHHVKARGGARGIPWYSSEYQCFFQHKAKEL